MNQKLQEAIDALPDSVKEYADYLFKQYSDSYPKDRNPGRIYLQQEILKRYPTYRFSKPIPRVEEKTSPKARKPVVHGTKTKASIGGKDIVAIECENLILVSRISLCKRFRWHTKKLTALSPTTPKYKRLKGAGYSFREYVAYANGSRQKPTFIPLADANIAVALYAPAPPKTLKRTA